jgi:D-3-phosphoglycerate dehydrogenase / 2-oxoglutarate reductase
MNAKPLVLVTDQINDAAVAILKPVCDVKYIASVTADELPQALQGCQGLMIRSASNVTPEVLAACPDLQIVGRAGVGVDNIDLAAANAQGVVVVNSPEGNTVAAAEHTIGLMFALVRHIPRGDASLKAGRWDRKALTGVELYNKTLGLIGFGKIGGRVAKVAKAAGMKVLVYDPFIAPDVAEAIGAVHTTRLADIWAEADIITVHVPKTRETTNLINAETLKACKSGVRFINCARGGIIEEAALAEALRSGHVAGAALDVFNQEPLEAESPLLHPDIAEKLVITPHLGASTEEAQVNVALDVAEQLRDYFANGTLRSVVNSPLLRSHVMDPARPYLPLAEALGRIGQQLLQGAISQVDITVKGSLTEIDISPLKLAVLKGLLGVHREGVNLINAAPIAKGLNMAITETKSTAASSLPNLLTVEFTPTTGRPLVLSGSLIAKDVLRIVDMDGFRTSLKPTAHMLMVPHEDKPGMIAKIGTVLGDANINISALQVGKSRADEKSIMLFNLDTPVEQTTLDAVRRVDGCFDAIALGIPE